MTQVYELRVEATNLQSLGGHDYVYVHRVFNDPVDLSTLKQVIDDLLDITFCNMDNRIDVKLVLWKGWMM